MRRRQLTAATTINRAGASASASSVRLASRASTASLLMPSSARPERAAERLEEAAHDVEDAPYGEPDRANSPPPRSDAELPA